MNVVENGQLVDHLTTALRKGEMAVSQIPGLVKKIIQDGMWKERQIKTRKVVRFETFLDFITTPPLEGLGEDPKVIERLIHDDPEALTLFREAVVRPNHRPAKDAPESSDIVTTSAKERGNTKAYTLKRLKDKSPGLYKDVCEGKLSANKAAIQAGIRKVPTTLDILKVAWTKATESERADFQAWIGEPS